MRVNLPAALAALGAGWYLLRSRSSSATPTPSPSPPSTAAGPWTDLRVAALGEYLYLTAPVFKAPPPEVILAARWASSPSGPWLGWTEGALAEAASLPFPPASMPEAALALAVAWSNAGEPPSTDAATAARIGELLGRGPAWVAGSTVAAARAYVETADTIDTVAAWVAAGGMTAEGEPLTGGVA